MDEAIAHGTGVILNFLGIYPTSLDEFEMFGHIECVEQEGQHFFQIDEMRFHNSYDWLSAPIQKLQMETEDAVELGDLMHDVFLCNRITAFRAVVKYIETHTKKYEVFVNGSWDAGFEEVPFVQVFYVGEIRRMSKFELNQFADKGVYDCYLCPDLFSHPKWNGEIKFIREDLWKQKN